ncbi:hypothetical protein NAPIS_ORF01911 [Vairimorpha apis BRL 01]|uniref:Uncharacterized protein n=1 Tax=Vairimorpha apis BRL 01 TaxID=1037528 RepID=T0KZ42_9MICR|nr:hypothetical protein NAPIS_ORF01911 [Vairimorpha apis BRL 01]
MNNIFKLIFDLFMTKCANLTFDKNEFIVNKPIKSLQIRTKSDDNIVITDEYNPIQSNLIKHSTFSNLHENILFSKSEHDDNVIFELKTVSDNLDTIKEDSNKINTNSLKNLNLKCPKTKQNSGEEKSIELQNLKRDEFDVNSSKNATDNDNLFVNNSATNEFLNNETIINVNLIRSTEKNSIPDIIEQTSLLKDTNIKNIELNQSDLERLSDEVDNRTNFFWNKFKSIGNYCMCLCILFVSVSLIISIACYIQFDLKSMSRRGSM